jgi:hypothetical protein
MDIIEGSNPRRGRPHAFMGNSCTYSRGEWLGGGCPPLNCPFAPHREERGLSKFCHIEEGPTPILAGPPLHPKPPSSPPKRADAGGCNPCEDGTDT